MMIFLAKFEDWFWWRELSFLKQDLQDVFDVQDLVLGC